MQQILNVPWNNSALVLYLFDECVNNFVAQKTQAPRLHYDLTVLRTLVKDGKCSYTIDPEVFETVEKPSACQLFRLAINSEARSLLNNLELRQFLGILAEKLYFLHTHDDEHIHYLEVLNGKM